MHTAFAARANAFSVMPDHAATRPPDVGLRMGNTAGDLGFARGSLDLSDGQCRQLNMTSYDGSMAVDAPRGGEGDGQAYLWKIEALFMREQ